MQTANCRLFHLELKNATNGLASNMSVGLGLTFGIVDLLLPLPVRTIMLVYQVHLLHAPVSLKHSAELQPEIYNCGSHVSSFTICVEQVAGVPEER